MHGLGGFLVHMIFSSLGKGSLVAFCMALAAAASGLSNHDLAAQR